VGKTLVYVEQIFDAIEFTIEEYASVRYIGVFEQVLKILVFEFVKLQNDDSIHS
jgi:hypothetical protein